MEMIVLSGYRNKSDFSIRLPRYMAFRDSVLQPQPEAVLQQQLFHLSCGKDNS